VPSIVPRADADSFLLIKLVYELPDLPDSPSGKMNLIVCSLQALFYALEIAERAVSESQGLSCFVKRLLNTRALAGTEPTIDALSHRAVTFGSERGETVRFAYDAINDSQLPGVSLTASPRSLELKLTLSSPGAVSPVLPGSALESHTSQGRGWVSHRRLHR
jgi:hypothetical protein